MAKRLPFLLSLAIVVRSECAVDCPDNYISGLYCDDACNNIDCSWDGGDCLTDCGCDISYIGNGSCDQDCNTLECSWDGNDCYSACECEFDSLGDGNCLAECNSQECYYDGGDCIQACIETGCYLNYLGDGV